MNIKCTKIWDSSLLSNMRQQSAIILNGTILSCFRKQLYQGIVSGRRRRNSPFLQIGQPLPQTQTTRKWCLLPNQPCSSCYLHEHQQSQVWQVTGAIPTSKGLQDRALWVYSMGWLWSADTSSTRELDVWLISSQRGGARCPRATLTPALPRVKWLPLQHLAKGVR